MKAFRIDMWQGGRKILLREMLDSLALPEGITWSLLHFSGSGVAPNGYRMEAFEAEVRNLAEGFPLNAEQLDQFADGLTDISDVQLVGRLEGETVVEINGLDSTTWEIALEGAFVGPKQDALLMSSGNTVRRVSDPPLS
jgi:hypothetical protein